jgi:hypothetical protein
LEGRETTTSRKHVSTEATKSAAETSSTHVAEEADSSHTSKGTPSSESSPVEKVIIDKLFIKFASLLLSVLLASCTPAGTSAAHTSESAEDIFIFIKEGGEGISSAEEVPEYVLGMLE